jgi:hypothetical protein
VGGMSDGTVFDISGTSGDATFYGSNPVVTAEYNDNTNWDATLKLKSKGAAWSGLRLWNDSTEDWLIMNAANGEFSIWNESDGIVGFKLDNSSNATFGGSIAAVGIDSTSHLTVHSGASYKHVPYYNCVGSDNNMVFHEGFVVTVPAANSHEITITHNDINGTTDNTNSFKAVWAYAEIILDIHLRSTADAMYNAQYRFKVMNAKNNTYYSEELLSTYGTIYGWVAKTLAHATVSYTDTTITISVDNPSSTYESSSFILTQGHAVSGVAIASGAGH